MKRWRAVSLVCALVAPGLSCASEHRGSNDTAAAIDGAAAPLEQPDLPDDYPCGGSATCDARYQLCEHIAGGPPPGLDMFACAPNPPECSDDRSCACLKPAVSAARCEGDGSHLTLWLDWD